MATPLLATWREQANFHQARLIPAGRKKGTPGALKVQLGGLDSLPSETTLVSHPIHNGNQGFFLLSFDCLKFHARPEGRHGVEKWGSFGWVHCTPWSLHFLGKGKQEAHSAQGGAGY